VTISDNILRKLIRILPIVIFHIWLLHGFERCIAADSENFKLPSLSLDLKQTDEPDEFVPALKIVLALTVLSIAPSILLMMTSFTRIIVVLSFLRQAIGAVNMPPNQVMIGLSLFLTYFTMAPVFNDVIDNAYKPFAEKKINQEQAFDAAILPLKDFMIKQTRDTDLNLFSNMRKSKDSNKENIGVKNKTIDKVELSVLIPAFMISELKTAFQIGFLIYIPFLVIDMVISSVLMAMGMVMLPPVVISLPFKIVLFVLIDGWSLITENLIRSFNG
jgi:flagellar biosynthetic protein FliP